MRCSTSRDRLGSNVKEQLVHNRPGTALGGLSGSVVGAKETRGQPCVIPARYHWEVKDTLCKDRGDD